MAVNFSGRITIPSGRIKTRSQFTQIQLPSPGNALFHIDAADATSVTLTGSSIDQINDQTSNNRNFVDGISKPVYVIAGQNGLNTMDFSSATVGTGTAYLTRSESLSIRHVFAVARNNFSTFTDFDGLFTTGSAALQIILTGSSGGTSWTSGVFPFSNYFQNLNNVPSAFITDQTAWSVYSISNSSPIVAGEWIIGHDREFMTRNWEGSIAEVVAYDIQLSPVDRDDLISQLMAKWGIS